MVKLKTQVYWESPLVMDDKLWLSSLPENYQNYQLLVDVSHYTFNNAEQLLGLGGISLWQHGLGIADSLIHLQADEETIAAALLYPLIHTQKNLVLPENIPLKISQLVRGAEQMESISVLHNQTKKNPAQVENYRKMLLAMADDLRVVLLKLAERLHALRTARFLPEAMQKQLADEVSHLYGPLANRLGLGQMKWEMEDLAFRIGSPNEYKAIAKALDMKRSEREKLVRTTLQILTEELDRAQIKPYELMGRAKHIYSIHRKMVKKNVDLNGLFDIIAVRVLVESLEDCYRVLDIVQQKFEMIPQEFDDYVAAPKPNGYRSIHTAVFGPDNHVVEIQIRTFKMHEESELGVAAHWRYKEGGHGNQSYETKIAWLRELLSWQKEMEQEALPVTQVLADRVYVLTPQNDIVDLPKGATPLDFAYHIHTNVGHRCRGAKVNGHIVPLSTVLKMGDRVEVLTNKEPNPSRDWLSPHAGYLFTSRARQKVAHFLREKNYDVYLIDGRNLLEKELKHWNCHQVDYDELSRLFEQKNKEELFVAIGSGEIRPTQLSGRLENLQKNANASNAPMTTRKKSLSKAALTAAIPSITIEGENQLLNHVARCCEPKPGDAIAAYVSQRRGVSIHKISCANFIARKSEHPHRVLQARWE